MKSHGIFYLFAVFILFALVITYSNHFNNGFHFDDSHTLQTNIYIKDIKNVPLFFKDGRYFSSLPQNQGYRPLLSTLYAVSYWMGGGFKLFYFHLPIFIFYILQLILMYFLYLNIMNRALDDKWNKYIALFAVSWYGLHTANTETINYISASSDSISTFWLILSLLLFMVIPGARKWGLYLLPIAAGILFKQAVLVFPAILFVYVLLFEQNIGLNEITHPSHFKKILNAVWVTLPSFAVCFALYILQAKMTPETSVPAIIPRFFYIITQPFVILHYFKTFFLPTGLSADTDWTTLSTVMDYRFFVGTAFIFLMVTIAYITSKKNVTRPISFGILWFFIASIPTSSGIVVLSEVLNDHRIFFPYVGLMLSVCWALGLFIKKYERAILKKKSYQFLIFICVFIVLGSHAYGTYQRNKVWHDEESLWYDVTIKSPKNGRGLMNYGLTQMTKGKYDVALSHFERALIYTPYYPYLHVNLGILKNSMNQPLEAEEYFKKALQFGPNLYVTYLYYGRFLTQHHRFSEAIPMLEKTLQLSPAYMEARHLLMDSYAYQSEWEKLARLSQQTMQIVPKDRRALKYLEVSKNRKFEKKETGKELVKSAPTPENLLNLSLTYYQQGLYEKCIEACQEALKLRPDYAEAYNNLCAAYNALKKWDEGIKACEKAIQLKPDFQLAKNNLAWAKREKALQKK